MCVCCINFKKMEILMCELQICCSKDMQSGNDQDTGITVGRSVLRMGVIFLKSEKLTQPSVGGGWASYILSLI